MVVGVVPEPSKESDGWYCPIDASYVTLNGLERGKINLSLLGSNYTDGTGQVVNGNKIGEDDRGGSRLFSGHPYARRSSDYRAWFQ